MTERERDEVLDWLNQMANTDGVDWMAFYSDSETRSLASKAIKLIEDDVQIFID